MPEGDTVHKLARALAPELEARPLRGLWLRDRGWLAPLAGHTVCEVSALGKHLLVGLAPPGGERAAWVLHVHLGMKGRWDRYREGEAWRRPIHQASVRLEAPARSYVCFRAARAEVLRPPALALHPTLSRLGPDLVADRLDLRRVVARARAREPRSAAELLLDQRVACGIGNVYKSEVLFLEGVHPRTSVAALPDAALGRLYARARTLLRANLGGWRRTTLRSVTPASLPAPGEPRLWVYGRGGEPCRRCGAAIRGARVGDEARSSFWCPGCQRAPAGRGGAPAG